MQQLLQQAIAGKRMVSFVYKGHTRTVEPHVLGIKSGVTGFLGYQVAGTSNSGGRLPEWRRFELPHIVSLQILKDTFPGVRPFPSGNHSAWDTTLAIVA